MGAAGVNPNGVWIEALMDAFVMVEWIGGKVSVQARFRALMPRAEQPAANSGRGLVTTHPN
jgi:hypothetical protein